MEIIKIPVIISPNMQESILTPDFLKSSRRAGHSDSQIADVVAKRDMSFAKDYDLIKRKSERYSNPDVFVRSFLNQRVYGDATYEEQDPVENVEARYNVPGAAGFSRNDIMSGNPATAGLKTAANFGAGVAKLPLTIGKGLFDMATHPIETLRAGGLAVEGAISDVYQGVTGKQAPTFKAGGQFGNPDDISTDKLTPGQEQFHEGFLENTLGLSSALRGDFSGAADRVVTGLMTDPSATALALSPLTRRVPKGKGVLDPVSTKLEQSA